MVLREDIAVALAILLPLHHLETYAWMLLVFAVVRLPDHLVHATATTGQTLRRFCSTATRRQLVAISAYRNRITAHEKS